MRRKHARFLTTLLCSATAAVALSAAPAGAAPKVVLISLDGAKPDLIELYQSLGILPNHKGLGRIDRFGARAIQNVSAEPSVTAVNHIAIATGSTAVHNDVVANSFHPVGAAIGTSISGFAAPIGGYSPSPLGPSEQPTAEPLWVRVRQAGRSVVTATWPGSDGADIRIAGTLVQAAVPTRTNDYTVPFGGFGGLGAQGFALGASNFQPASAELAASLAAAGFQSFAPMQVSTAPLETVFCAPVAPATCGTTADGGRTLRYDLTLAALDTSDDGSRNYDALVVFDAAGSLARPAALPSTGPALLRQDGHSARFFFEGSGSKVGTQYFVSRLAPDLSDVHIARYGASFIPRTPAVLADVDDVNANVGFWASQADFRIPERLAPGFDAFPDSEVEAIYRDQVDSFVDYQTRVALRAIERHPNADLVMIYIEQPDGSGHQFTLTDLRQATDPRDPTSIGLPGFPRGATGQNFAKVRRYGSYVAAAYKAADRAVERIVQATGLDRHGRPLSDVFVVSDHGMAPFHTAVALRNLLEANGIDTSQLALRTTGPAANIYVNLAGREPGGTVTADAYPALVAKIAEVLRGARDANLRFNPFARRLFSDVYTRPTDCGRPGSCTSEHIGQDSGDVFALMIEGYNFDGLQTPGVARLGDAAFDTATSVFSVPNFYGAHGHNSDLRSMSAILYAAGPSVRRGAVLREVHNIDIAPTLLEILGVTPAASVDGRVLRGLLR